MHIETLVVVPYCRGVEEPGDMWTGRIRKSFGCDTKPTIEGELLVQMLLESSSGIGLYSDTVS